jgi:hypothetical protein
VAMIMRLGKCLVSKAHLLWSARLRIVYGLRLSFAGPGALSPKVACG